MVPWNETARPLLGSEPAYFRAAAIAGAYLAKTATARVTAVPMPRWLSANLQ